MSGNGHLEGTAARAILDKSDSSRLSWREINDSYGSNTNFFLCHGLKPWEPTDQAEALDISRQIKANDKHYEAQQQSKKK